MKRLLSGLCFIFLSLHLSAQDINALLKEANRLEALPNEKAALLKFKEALKVQPRNIYALNKASELCSRIGKRQMVNQIAEDYYSAAKTYAGIALKIDPNNSESNCVMAIALGRSSLNKSGKEKLTSAKELRKHIDLAIKNDPSNFKAWHILGRWHYELSSLSMLEKTAVKYLYGGMPIASLSESLFAFEKSQSITDGFILNYFEMAKAYKKNNQKEKAIAVLRKMMGVPNQTEDDPVIKESGRKLLKEWGSS
jgi:tetratricopeptide (TPR) repeat protein